jgi:CubicO group peptidase (beta-lactamase class C family)
MTDGPVLPRSLAVLEASIRRNIHIGAQLHVSLQGRPVADVAIGLAAPDKPMTVESMMTWLSCSKIASSIAFAQLWERGDVALDDPVCAHIPEFAANRKERVTIRHVWTHTFGLIDVENALFAVRYRNTPEQNLRLICDAAMAPGWVLGRRAFYQTSAAFLLLAEIVRRKRGRDFRRVIRDELFLPLGLRDSWLGMSPDALARYRDRLGRTFDTTGAEPTPGSWAPDADHHLTHFMPGGNGRDSKVHHAGRNCASGYGLHASPRTFGHTGFRTTVALCDPEPGLVVCCSWNGMVGDDATHLARQNALCEAIYEDLGLAA